MTSIDNVTLDTTNLTASGSFSAAIGLGDLVRYRSIKTPSTGFRGFTVSLVVSQPSTVEHLVTTALDCGATSVKPAKKSFWGYGGVVQAPDGAIWKVATSAKKNTGPANRDVDDVVLLLGVDDVRASKRFYTDRGLTVGKSFGSKYVEFATPGSALKLALYGRRALAKDAGVAPEGNGSHGLRIGVDAEPFTDPDGFEWVGSSTSTS